MKQQVATSDGHCKADMPMMAWPDVQPPAYRVPKPTRKPPATIKINPRKVNSRLNANISRGSKPLKSFTPSCRNNAAVCGLILTGWAFDNQFVVIKPPIMIPKAKKRFQLSFFQSYLKKEICAGMQAAHTWRSVDDMPNDLLPINSNDGTISPISGPAIYQGHGCLIGSIYIYKVLTRTKSPITSTNQPKAGFSLLSFTYFVR